jgi:GNAT superfamily N-acetyltransferase
MSMYGEYIKERLGDEIIETEQGFATYRFINEGKSVYIIDLYVHPDYRDHHTAAALADSIVDIARERGCVELIGTVAYGANTCAASLKTLLGYGMVPVSGTNEFILLKKVI